MPRLLALEWTDAEARLLLAGGPGAVERALRVDLCGVEPAGDPDAVGARIAAALVPWGVRTGEVLLAVGRAGVELRTFGVPPAPDDELPEIVRFLALREFAAIDEDWPLDFVPLAPEGETPQVLSVAIDPKSLAAIRAVCEAAGLRPRRLVLRPAAIASLAGRDPRFHPTTPYLIVDRFEGGAELSVIRGGLPLLLRAVRLPAEKAAGDIVSPSRADITSDRPHPLPLSRNGRGENEADEMLLAELRRTLAAVPNQFALAAVERLIVVGCGAGEKALAATLSASLGLPADCLDPLAGLTVAPEAQTELEKQPGRFAALIGLARDEAERRRPAIDLLQPRHRPEPPNRSLRYILGGIAVLLAIAAFFGWRWWDREQLQLEIQRLAAESDGWNEAVERAEAVSASAGEIDKWASSDFVWLNELRDLSGHFPPADQAMLTQMVLSARPGRGEIILEGLAREVATIDATEQALTDARHRVEGKGRSRDGTERYPWRFRSTVWITPK